MPSWIATYMKQPESQEKSSELPKSLSLSLFEELVRNLKLLCHPEKKLELTWSLQKNNKINHNQRTTPSSPFPWCAGSPQPPPPPRPLPPWRLPQRPHVRRTRPAAQSSEPVPRGAIGSLWDDGVSRMPINRGNYKQKPCVKHHLSWSQL